MTPVAMNKVFYPLNVQNLITEPPTALEGGGEVGIGNINTIEIVNGFLTGENNVVNRDHHVSDEVLEHIQRFPAQCNVDTELVGQEVARRY